MNDNLAQRIFFGVLLIGVTIAFVWLVRGFLHPIFWAVALGIVFFPMHTKVRDWLKGRDSLAAAASVILILLIVVLPLAAIITAMAGEAAALADRIAEEQMIGRAQLWITQRLPDPVLEWLASYEIDIARLASQLSSSAISVSQFVATQAVAIGQNTIRIVVYFFLMLYLLFFFMRDGTRMVEGMVRALPFGDERERHLLERFAQVSRATIKGTLVVGIVQGTIGGILFAILGITGPVLWGVVMALFSIIPAVGPAVIWLPAAIILIVNGSIISGIVLIVVGAVVIGLADNMLRPLLVGRDTKMPDYLILLSTLGGLTAFGIAGVVIGPIIAAFFLSIWEMAEAEYADNPLGDED
jgi:predicted PurR-regulated permease PerM